MRVDRRVVAASLLGGAILQVLLGCSLRNRLPRSEPAAPTITFYEADSAAAGIVGPPSSLPRWEEEPKAEVATRPAPREQTPSRPVSPKTPAPAQPQPPDTVQASPPISLDLPYEERAGLWKAAMDDLAVAKALVAQASARIVSTEGLEKIQTVRGLIEQAEAAIDRDDLQGAANLARKARLLGEKLPSH